MGGISFGGGDSKKIVGWGGAPPMPPYPPTIGNPAFINTHLQLNLELIKRKLKLHGSGKSYC